MPCQADPSYRFAAVAAQALPSQRFTVAETQAVPLKTLMPPAAGGAAYHEKLATSPAGGVYAGTPTHEKCAAFPAGGA